MRVTQEEIETFLFQKKLDEGMTQKLPSGLKKKI